MSDAHSYVIFMETRLSPDENGSSQQVDLRLLVSEGWMTEIPGNITLLPHYQLIRELCRGSPTEELVGDPGEISRR